MINLEIFKKEFRYQFLATFIVQLTAFIFGIVIGFTGPNLELFKSDASPLKSGKITAEEESWISSLAAFGAIGFVLIYGWISERFGRKIAILLIGIPQTLSWVFMALAKDVLYIYISRLLSGIAGAGCFYVAPVYVAEISDKRIRGALCASFSVICNIGIFIEFILAEYMHFRSAAILTCIVSVGFLIGFTFMPESPQYLISKRKFEEAEIAYKFFRGQKPNENLSENNQTDFNSLKEIAKDHDRTESQFKVFRKHISQPGTIKGIFIAVVVAQFPVMSGCFVLITYNQGIFTAANVTVLSVFWSSLAFAFIQIIAAICTARYVDKVGRRKILVWSSFSTAICLAIFGAYMFLKTRSSIDLTNVTWIPLISLLVQVFVSSVGIIPVPNFYVSEILDQKVRSLVVSICSWWSWIEGFLIIKFYPPIEHSFGIDPVMFFFAFTSCFCGLFTLFLLPETKGRNIEEIAKSIGKSDTPGDKKVNS
jgi:SP family facilitated glucose transporter-like MFS transporter 8